MKPRYLGDSVYAEAEGGTGGMVCIYTDNGYGPRNVIYLEREVFLALVAYGREFWEAETGESERR